MSCDSSAGPYPVPIVLTVRYFSIAMAICLWIKYTAEILGDSATGAHLLFSNDNAGDGPLGRHVDVGAVKWACVCTLTG